MADGRPLPYVRCAVRGPQGRGQESDEVDHSFCVSPCGVGPYGVGSTGVGVGPTEVGVTGGAPTGVGLRWVVPHTALIAHMELGQVM